MMAVLTVKVPIADAFASRAFLCESCFALSLVFSSECLRTVMHQLRIHALDFIGEVDTSGKISRGTRMRACENERRVIDGCGKYSNPAGVSGSSTTDKPPQLICWADHYGGHVVVGDSRAYCKTASTLQLPHAAKESRGGSRNGVETSDLLLWSKYLASVFIARRWASTLERSSTR